MKELGLQDVWREVNPSKRDFTFFSHPHSCYSRLDYFFMFQKDFHRVLNCKIGVMDLLDLTPVYFETILSEEKRDTSWRLNTSILHPMREQIREDIKNYMDENDNGEVSPIILWDALKSGFKGEDYWI